MNFEWSKKNHRKISSFFGDELIYDYISLKLDQERQSAMESYLQKSVQAQSEVQRYIDALDYLQDLSKIRTSRSLMDSFKNPTTYLHLLMRKLRYDRWSPGLKMGLEVLIVAVGVIACILVFPWQKLINLSITGDQEIILAEVEHNKNNNLDIEVSGSPEITTVLNADVLQKLPILKKPLFTTENFINPPAFYEMSAPDPEPSENPAPQPKEDSDE